MPVISAIAKRSFSALKRIRTYLRSTMIEDRLSGLSVMHVHPKIELDIDKAMNRMETENHTFYSLIRQASVTCTCIYTQYFNQSSNTSSPTFTVLSVVVASQKSSLILVYRGVSLYLISCLCFIIVLFLEMIFDFILKKETKIF